MLYNSQRVITSLNARIDLSDASVMGGSQLTISAGSGVTLELSPDGDWIVV